MIANRSDTTPAIPPAKDIDFLAEHHPNRFLNLTDPLCANDPELDDPMNCLDDPI